eukprot:Lithocolla_globosa_v1_NODE_59_length_7384_cov_30.397053.p3 type:complete len:144 gc:universal NODE_59_length_7384_cov_30.397053:7104-6673(-)
MESRQPLQPKRTPTKPAGEGRTKRMAKDYGDGSSKDAIRGRLLKKIEGCEKRVEASEIVVGELNNFMVPRQRQPKRMVSAPPTIAPIVAKKPLFASFMGSRLRKEPIWKKKKVKSAQVDVFLTRLFQVTLLLSTTAPFWKNCT